MAAEERSLSIAQWCMLARQGIVLPMHIPLDGDSMRPLIRRGLDRVTIVPLARSLRLGDVVLFEYPAGRYVVHRVRRIRGEWVQTLGDHCWNPDAWMPHTCVLGLAVQVKRDGKSIPLNRAIARAFGRIWMAGLPLRRTFWKCRARVGRTLRKWIPRR